jgi:carbamoyl-phosphate synthase small subunit
MVVPFFILGRNHNFVAHTRIMNQSSDYAKRPPAYLLLADGTLFEGKAIGKIGTTGGEICFNTGMTGYQEIYTDPSYYGQIIVNTTSHIGNYGVHAEEIESARPQIAGLVVNDFSEIASRPSASGTLQDYLTQHGIVGISDIDTRRLVRHLRSRGAMNAVISSEFHAIADLQSKLDLVPSMDGLELSSVVSTKEAYFYGDPQAEFKVVALDYGIKTNILRNLAARGCYIKVFPAKTSLEEMDAWQADGYFLSNGPGDPAVMSYAVETVKRILERDKPVFGICLGHQILARACGCGTFKMHHGHRGINHPVKNLKSGLGEITSQNHGFAVNRDDVEQSELVTLTHVHLNDHTVAGISVKGKPAFSVQYHPESSPGPHDSRYLFDEFIHLLQSKKS